MYYCQKCKHNHSYTSKIGEKHLKYKADFPEKAGSELEISAEPDNHMILDLIEDVKDTIVEPADQIPPEIIEDKKESIVEHESQITLELIEEEMGSIVEPDNQIIPEPIEVKEETIVEPDTQMTPDLVEEDEESVETRPSNRLGRFIDDYRRSYRKGTEKFGVWWKVFQISIWSIILIFLIMAGLIIIVYLPQIDMINWILGKY